MNTIEKLQKFANDHGVVLDLDGTVGMGRPCVGFTHGNGYVDICPIRMGGDYDRVPGFDDERVLEASPFDAYHKHNCLAVLVETDREKAIEQLGQWVDAMNEIVVEMVDYPTGATGPQALMTPRIGKAVKPKEGGPGTFVCDGCSMTLSIEEDFHSGAMCNICHASAQDDAEGERLSGLRSATSRGMAAQAIAAPDVLVTDAHVAGALAYLRATQATLQHHANDSIRLPDGLMQAVVAGILVAEEEPAKFREMIRVGLTIPAGTAG